MSRWRPVLAFTAVSAGNQMLWLTYAPITTGSARHYGVSEGAIGWLAEIFPFLYVVLAVPAGRLLQRDLARWLAGGAILTALGGLIRLVGDDYVMALSGQALIAVAQPLVLTAVVAVSIAYLSESERSRGIAVSSAGVFAGFVLALVMGPVFGAQHLTVLLVVQAALAVLAAAWLVLELLPNRRPSTAIVSSADVPPSPVITSPTDVPSSTVIISPAGPGNRASDRDDHELAGTGSFRTVLRDRFIRILLGLICAGFGVFVAITTWLQALLEPAGVSESEVGVMLLSLVLAGVVGSAVLPPWLSRRGWSVAFIAVSVGAGAAALVLLVVVPGVVSGFVASIVLGAFLLTDLPVVLELAERRAGSAATTATALVWLAGNAAGLVVALLVQALVHHPPFAFAVLTATLVAAAPLVTRLRTVRVGPAGVAPAS